MPRAFTRLVPAAALLLGALFLGCESKKQDTPPPPAAKQVAAAMDAAPGGGTGGSDMVLIGHFASMTGSEATFGVSTENGIMLAVEEANAAGGVRKKKIKVLTYDDQGKESEATTVVTRFITQDKVTALLGEVASSRSIAGARVAQKYGVPMITPSSTNEDVTKIGSMISRVCFIDNFQGIVCAKFVRENLKMTKVACLYDQRQAYSTGLNDTFKKAFTGMGGTIVADVAYSGGDSDFGAQLTTIREKGAEAIFIPGYYTEVANIALQARKLGITAPLIGGDGWESPKLAEIGGAAIEGSYYANHFAPQDTRPIVQDFVKRFKAKYGQTPDSLSVMGYDATKVLIDAMMRAPSWEGKALAKAIAETKDFPGVSGTITMDKDRNPTKSAVILQMKGGLPVYCATIDPPKSDAK